MIFKKLVAALSAVTMLGSLAVAVPASAADTDASVVAFDNFRVNNGKSKTVDDITYYGNAHMTNILTGAAYNGGTSNKAESLRSNRFYSLMRISLPSGNTKSVTVSFPVTEKDCEFDIFAYSSKVEWKDLPYTDNTHAGVTDGDYQTYYDASVAAGYDWSGLGTNTFAATTPLVSLNTDANKNIEFTLSKEDGGITDADLTAGYKDILIAGKSAKACNMTVPLTPTISTELYEVAEPVAKIGSTEYASFAEAMKAATEDSVITLLADVETYDRFTQGTADDKNGKGVGYTRSFNAPNLTINGDGHTIKVLDVSGDNWSFLFETNGRKLTLNNVTVETDRARVVSIKNGSETVLNGVSIIGNAVAVYLDNLATNTAVPTTTITDLSVTASNDRAIIGKREAGTSLGTLSIGLASALAAQYDVVDGVLKEKTVTPEPKTTSYAFHSTIQQLKAKDDVTVTVSADGYDTSDPVSIKEKIAELPDGDGELLLGIVLTLPDGLDNVKVVVE